MQGNVRAGWSEPKGLRWFRALALGLWVWELGISGLGSRLWGLEFRVLIVGLEARGFRIKV